MITSDTAELQLQAGDVTIKRAAAITMDLIETIFGKSMYKIRFSDRDVDVWNKIAAQVDITGSIRIGAVTDAIPDGLWSDWKEFRVTQLTLKSEGDVVHATIVAQDGMYSLQGRASQKVFTNKSIQEMVEEFASDHDLKSDVISTTDKYNVKQGLYTDYDFIRTELIPRSRSVDEDDLFLLYINQDKNGQKLVFTTFKELAKKKPQLTFSYDPQEPSPYDPIQRAYLTTFIATSWLSDDNFGKQGVSFDPLKSQGIPDLLTAEYNDNDVNYPSLRAETPERIGDSPAKIEPFVMEMLDLDLQKEVKTRLQWDNFFSHRMAIPTQLLPLVKVGALAQVEAETGTGEKLFCSGTHLIYAVHHRVQPSGKTSTMTFLARRGAVRA